MVGDEMFENLTVIQWFKLIAFMSTINAIATISLLFFKKNGD
jgi:hypothetical protein